MMNIAVAAAWVAFALWAAKIGYQKGHPLAGLILGATLAYVGVILIALFPKSKANGHELPTQAQVAARMKVRKHRASHNYQGAHAKVTPGKVVH